MPDIRKNILLPAIAGLRNGSKMLISLKNTLGFDVPDENIYLGAAKLPPIDNRRGKADRLFIFQLKDWSAALWASNADSAWNIAANEYLIEDFEVNEACEPRRQDYLQFGRKQKLYNVSQVDLYEYEWSELTKETQDCFFEAQDCGFDFMSKYAESLEFLLDDLLDSDDDEE